MLAGINSVLGMHEHALKIREARQGFLANNIANADTPNFQAQDLDFNTSLDALSSGDTEALNISNPNHLSEANQTFEDQAFFRVPLQPSLDGNTVDIEKEKAEFSKNAISYNASLTFLNHQLRTMMMAIRGE